MARSLIALVIVAGTAMLAAACGSSEEGPVRFLVFGDPEEIQAYRQVAADYEEQSGDDVQLVEASDRSDLIARLSTSIAAGAPPDVFLMNYRYYAQFAARGAIEPVTERLDGSEAFEREDFYPIAMDAFRWRGEQLCIPQNISSLVVYYNRGLFEKYGVPEPEDDWTWNTMVGHAATLTRDANGRQIRPGDPDSGGATAAVYGLGVDPSIIRVAPFVWSNGAELVDDDAKPTRFTLDTPKAQEALRGFLDLRLAYGVIPSDVEVEAQDDETRFANGGLAMLLSSRRSTPLFRTITAFDWDVAPPPRWTERAGILHSDAFCITSASERKNTAWDFVEYALGPEGQATLAESGRTVPSLIEVSQSEAFLDPSKPPKRARVFLDGIPSIRVLPVISTWPEIEDATGPILENGLYLGQPASEVAERIDSVTRPLFARGETP